MCDTNVLLSGFLFGGHCREIILRVSEGKDDGFISSSLLAELEGVLARPKFGLEAAQIAGIIDLVRQTFLLATPVESIEEARGILAALHGRVRTMMDDPRQRYAGTLLRGSVAQFNVLLAQALARTGDPDVSLGLYRACREHVLAFYDAALERVGSDLLALDTRTRNLREKIAAQAG